MSDPENLAPPEKGLPTCSYLIEDTAERYVLGRLPCAEAEILETHLIGCVPCQNLVEETELFISAFQRAAARLESD